MSQLGTAELDEWRALRAADPALKSPYFDPAFSQSVDAGRNSVLVAIGTTPQGVSYLPFERHGNIGLPAGYPGSDYHAPIATSGMRLHGQALLRAAGIARFVYNHLSINDASADWPVEAYDRTYHMDLGGGLDGYGKRHRDGHVPDHIRKVLKVARKAPDLNFELDCRDPRMLQKMIEWKRRQYISTGAIDHFSDPRAIRVVHSCFERQEPGCTGLLSVLRQGDQPIAVHFGLRAGGLLHSWLPAYDPDFGKYSPGVLLTIYIIEQADAAGLTRMDFGTGETEYKRRLMTGAESVGMGEIDRLRWRGGMRRSYRQAWRNLRDSRFYDQLRKIKARAQTGG